MSKLRLTICIGLLGTALVACERSPNTPATADGNPVIDPFTREQQAWRDERKANLTKPDGWTSLIGLHWIESGAHYVGSDPDNGIRLAMGPAHLGLLDRKRESLRFTPEKDTALTLDGEPLEGGTNLRSDDAEGGPSKLAFDEGKGIATVIKRGDRYALRVRHADAPTRTGFKGIDYWPADTGWVVTGKFVPHPAGKTIPIANIIGTTDEVPNPGAVEFERDGQVFRLEALDEGGDELFLVFADRTSGKGSYPAGRFLDAPKPDAQGRMRLDFNKAYNPPCAFTAFATCPLPPNENRLDLAIHAGEKTYHYEEPATP
ncbi:MAG TPA: DUF1684 domain-containing protein [Lysobacter sp.]